MNHGATHLIGLNQPEKREVLHHLFKHFGKLVVIKRREAIIEWLSLNLLSKENAFLELNFNRYNLALKTFWRHTEVG